VSDEAGGGTSDYFLHQRIDADPNFLAIGVEMRPPQSGGTFDLSASQIAPAGRELLASVVAVARAHYDRVN
jgi:hypothetical protein